MILNELGPGKKREYLILHDLSQIFTLTSPMKSISTYYFIDDKHAVNVPKVRRKITNI